MSSNTRSSLTFLLPFTIISPFRTNLRLARNVPLDLTYWNITALVSMLNIAGAPLRTPFKVWEWLRYNRQVASTEIEKPPVFIIGHWRSGTSHLHNIMANDHRYGFVTEFQAVAQDLFLAGRHVLKPLLASMFPATRIVDNVKFSLDVPEEEEQAIARVSRYSFYRQWTYPQMARPWFHHYVLFDDVKPIVIKRWKRQYLRVLSKTTIASRGKPLMLKNPVNVARMNLILEMFPNAKFIHIYRDPYRVFQSTEQLYRRSFGVLQLQRISRKQMRSNILYFYEKMMKKYLQDREGIPSDRLVEVRYEDLDANPTAEIERIYERLDLPDYELARPRIEEYLNGLKRYRKNSYEFDSEMVRQVNEHWGFAFDAFGYDRL